MVIIEWFGENKQLEIFKQIQTIGNFFERTNTDGLPIVLFFRKAVYDFKQIFAATSVGLLGASFQAIKVNILIKLFLQIARK